jgi:hypothetical protein
MSEIAGYTVADLARRYGRPSARREEARCAD